MDKKTVNYRDRTERPGRLYWLDCSGAMQRTQLTGVKTMGRLRSRSDADIQLASSYVSARHGEFFCSDDGCLYRDVGSGNGTWVDGVLLYGDEMSRPVRLEDGSIIRIGMTDVSEMPDNVVMLYTTRHTDEEFSETFEPDADVLEFKIGRGEAVGSGGGIHLTDSAVSACHCVFRRTMDGWSVENSSNTNPTLLNGGQLPYPSGLQPLDVVRLANSYVVFDGTRFHILADRGIQDDKTDEALPKGTVERDEASATGVSLSIHIARRSIRRRAKKIDLLRDIRLSISCGEMALILGGSGAGKTTFLNAVMGYEPAEGTIRFGETDLYNEYEKMKYRIGYVRQDDLLRKSDLVFDTLDNAAKMKLPRAVSESERLRRVHEVLSLFGLERERDQYVSKLSGGQRKRLSIAVEYVSDPTLFFLDEPDSGLDGIMARGLMENLRFIADSGKIVMVITHSPDRVRELFDKVIVLAKSATDNCGHLAFYGSCSSALAFFGVESMEGIVRKINRPDEGGEGLADFFIQKYVERREGNA